MNSTLFSSESDLQSVRSFIKELPNGSSLVDFEELIQLALVRASTRLWWNENTLIGLAYIDDSNNLWFEIDPLNVSPQLEEEVIAWGVTCMQRRNTLVGRSDTLDASRQANNTLHLNILENHGFSRCGFHTIHYSRSLKTPIPKHALPAGFSLRHVKGEEEVEALVALHRAAFKTENMSIERRLAIMRTQEYDPSLDLLVEAPNGDLAAFCVCGLVEGANGQTGYTDPIGIHPLYQRMGLGKAVITAGLKALRSKGAETATLGTSSENIAMQHLAESLGFTIASENIWLTKNVSLKESQ